MAYFFMNISRYVDKSVSMQILILGLNNGYKKRLKGILDDHESVSLPLR